MAKTMMIAAKVDRSQKQVVRSAATLVGESESAFLRRLALAEAARILSQYASQPVALVASHDPR
jgi:uncharacterized protein (DUF1778 family)